MEHCWLCAGGCGQFGWFESPPPGLPVRSLWVCEGAAGGRGTGGIPHPTARVRALCVHMCVCVLVCDGCPNQHYTKLKWLQTLL